MYSVFIVQAFERETPQGDYIDYAKLEMIAKTEEEAIKKAKKYIKKKFYRIAGVIEKYK